VAVEFASLPDTHRFTTSEDGSMVAAVAAVAAHGGTVSYSTNDAGELLAPIVAFGTDVSTVGELRELLRANPAPEVDSSGIGPFKPIVDTMVNIVDSITMSRIRTSTLLRLLKDKGILTAEEWGIALQDETSKRFWALRDQLTMSPSPENDAIYAETYPADVIAINQQLNMPAPPPGHHRLFPTHSTEPTTDGE
jgi:hypothetical protein